MSSRPIDQKRLTIAEFLKAYAKAEERYELVDGIPVMMAGANRRHVRIMANLVRRLGERLDGGPCEVLAADMGLAVSEYTYRLPDVGIYCDPRDTGPAAVEPMTLSHPKVLIEILSRSTEANDHTSKLDEYQAITSVDTIVLVHSSRNAFTTYERVSDNEWRTIVHLPGQSLRLRDPAVEIAAAEIFERVETERLDAQETGARSPTG